MPVMKTPLSLLATLSLTLFALSLTSSAKVTVKLKDANGKNVGSALMYESDGMVIQLDLHDLPRENTQSTFTRTQNAIRQISNPLAVISILMARSTALRTLKVTMLATCKALLWARMA